MHMHKRMVQRGDFHGSERRLPWFRATTSIVGLRDFHGSAFEDAWFRFRTSIHCYETISLINYFLFLFSIYGYSQSNTQPLIYGELLQFEVRWSGPVGGSLPIIGLLINVK